MLKEWQFNVLFFVGVGGAAVLLIANIGFHVESSPNAVMGVGAILTYVLTQRKSLTKNGDKKPKKEEPDEQTQE